MPSVSAMILAVLLVFGASAPAFAQSSELGSPGVDPGYENDDRGGVPDDFSLDGREAVRAARSVGLVDPENVDRQGRNWVIEGTDREGLDMIVTVDGSSGEVIDID